MSGRPIIRATVTFLSEEDGGRQQPPVISGTYRPHLVAGPITQRKAIHGENGLSCEHYIGVQFCGPEQRIVAKREYEVTLALVFHPRVDYAVLEPGTTFTIREGGAIVGFGVVDVGIARDVE